MAHHLTCSRGHFWTSDQEVGSACPLCGETGQTADTTHATEIGAIDELPPAPRHSRHATPQWPSITGYEIEGVLGRGGMGVVYKARQLSLGRVVALKMILAGIHLNAEALARFRAEALTLARVPHPNIVHIYDVLEVEGTPCFAMEFVEGGSLEEQLAGRPMTPERAATLVRTLARAVHAAHERGVVHRDLKPANILIALDGTPKITDFGLAKRLDEESKHTKSGHIMGTPHYMAPEQAEGMKTIGPAADVYALGAILYETLTGVPPFRGESAARILKQVLFDEAISPSRVHAGVPPELESICLKCLSKDPAKRYASAAALAGELDQCLAVSPNRVQSVSASVALPAGPPAKRSRRIWGAALALILFFATMLAFVPEVRNWVFERFRAVEAVSEPAKIHVQWEVLDGPAKEKDEAFDRIAFPNVKVGYLASRRAVYKTHDAGATWQKMKLDPPGRGHVLHFVDDKNGWLGTDKLRHTSDGGETWTGVALGDVKMRAVTALAFHPKGWALVGGATDADTIGLFHRADVQAKWERLALTGDLKAHEKWTLASLAVNEDVALAVLFDPDSGGGAVLRKPAGDPAWKRVLTTDDDLYRVHLNAKGEAWLAGLSGALWHSTDGGASFDAHPNPDPDRATPVRLTFELTDRLGLAPLWKGKLLVKLDRDPWTIHETPLGYSLADAVVVNAGCAYVLGADGRVARFLDRDRNKRE